MRISDWSSDVCSSDLADFGRYELRIGRMGRYRRPAIVPPFGNLRPAVVFAFPDEIELVAAARPHFMRPEVAGLVEGVAQQIAVPQRPRSEEHTSELQSLMRISYAVLCLKKKKNRKKTQ